MTDKNLTEMIFVLDQSGSMCSLTNDTIGGFNSLIKTQREEDEANGTSTNVTTVLFDNFYEVLHDGVPISDIKELTDEDYRPRGTTALLDAIGTAVSTAGGRLANMGEDERPGNVMVVIITDGQENSSKEYTSQRIKDMITEQEEKYSWVFNFLGAEQNSFAVANSYGINSNNVAVYKNTSQGVGNVYGAVSRRMTMSKVARANCSDFAPQSLQLDLDSDEDQND